MCKSPINLSSVMEQPCILGLSRAAIYWQPKTLARFKWVFKSKTLLRRLPQQILLHIGCTQVMADSGATKVAPIATIFPR